MRNNDESTPISKHKVLDVEPGDIAAYLQANPTFFQDRDDLLLQLYLPHQRDGSVSLVERQVSLLRERNQKARRQLENIMVAATHNNKIFDKCKAMIVKLLEAETAAAFFDALESSFKADFGASAYSLIIFDDRPGQINHFTYRVTTSSARDYIGALMDNTDPLLGVLRDKEQDFLFRHASDKVKSAAVIPIRNGDMLALLAIGSDDAFYFESGLGTIFISFIADVLSRLLPRYVD